MSHDVGRQVELLKAMADATRLRILGLVAERPRSGRELADALGLSAATISHHMARLTEVGIVRVETVGAGRRYLLDDTVLGAARGEGTPASGPDDAYHAKVVRSFFDGRRLTQIPAKRRARVAVLVELLRWFEPGRDYTESEVNAILRVAHADVAFLRRELVDYRYLTRAGGIYRVTSEVPHRDATEAQEVPAGESEWLGAFLRSALPKPTA